jgi:hypothetical protein
MPNILRSRLALVALVGAFLIPIGMSSLRGLTHVLTCKEQARTPFTVLVGDGRSEAVTSTRLARDEAPICGGLSLDLGARLLGPQRAAMVVPITNGTEHPWRGSVALVMNGTTIPVDIGEIPPRSTASDTVELNLERGAHELNGSLLIGP